jgi:hypothetical protein
MDEKLLIKKVEMFCDAFENDQPYQNTFAISLFILKYYKI